MRMVNTAPIGWVDSLYIMYTTQQKWQEVGSLRFIYMTYTRNSVNICFCSRTLILPRNEVSNNFPQMLDKELCCETWQFYREQ